MNVLVTGGAGFLGSHLVDRLLREGHEVTSLDNYWRGSKDNLREARRSGRLTEVEADILDLDAVRAAMRGAEIVWHLAAINGTRYFYEEPLLVSDVNVRGSEHVFRAAAESDPIPRVVFASTSEIYGEPEEIPTPETARARFETPTETLRHSYSVSKFLGEILAHGYAMKRSVPITILRYFNIYGPRLVGTSYGQVVSIFFLDLLAGRPVTLFGDGLQTRSFTFVTDAIDATYRAGIEQRAKGETFNVGLERETSIAELLRMVASELGVEHRAVHEPARVGDCRRRAPVSTRARSVLGWKPEVTLEEGLRLTAEWFARQRKGS